MKTNRLDLPLSLREFAEYLGRIERAEALPVGTRNRIDSVELDWDHRDPADRMIVATAALHASPIVTSNTVIRDFYSQTVW